MTNPEVGFLPPELAVDEPPISDAELFSEPPVDVELERFPDVEWAFRRLAKAQAALDELAEQYAEMIGRIEQWYQEGVEPHRSAVRYLTGLIERYALARRTREPDGPATFAFPSGKVVTRRTTEPAIVIADEKELIRWLAEDPKLAAATCRISLHPRITDLRERMAIAEDAEHDPVVVTHDGEVVPGLAVQEPGVEVTKVQLTQEDNDQ